MGAKLQKTSGLSKELPHMALIFSLLPSLALAADPAVTAPVPPPTTATSESHITVVDRTAQATGGINAVITISCVPDPASKFRYLDSSLTDYTSENAALVAAGVERSDVHLIVDAVNATPAELLAKLKELDEAHQDPFRLMIVSISCPASGGDTDEEVFYMNGGTLPGSDLLAALKPLADSSVWFLDTSRNVSSALDTTSFGLTADDVIKAGMPDTIAISSSAPGKYGGQGLVEAAAGAIRATAGKTVTLGDLYYTGIRPRTSLELYTSMGITSGDSWNENSGRMILPGGQLILPIADVPPPSPTNRPIINVPKGCWIASGGVLGLAGTAALGWSAAADYQWLDRANEGTITPTSEEATTVNRRYIAERDTAVVLGVVSVAAIAVGTGWTTIEVKGRDGHDTTVTAAPMGAGAMVTVRR